MEPIDPDQPLEIAVIAGVAVAVWVWRRRAAIALWIRTRERGVKLALVAGLLALVPQTRAEVKVTPERSENGAASFKFSNVPAPRRADAVASP